MNIRIEKLLLAFFSVAILFAAASSAEAQRTEMPYKEADAVISASRRMLMDTPNRQTYTEEKFAAAGAKAKPSRLYLTEDIPSKAKRTLWTTWSEDGKKETKEFIYVDGASYWRTNKQKWITAKVNGIDTPLVGGPAPFIVGHKQEAWLVEELTENGRKIKVYETKNSYTYLEKRVRTTYVATVRHWIRDDGLTIRRTSENTVVGKPEITKGTWEFEYENIDIKAPKL